MNDCINQAIADINAASDQLGCAIKKLEKTLKKMGPTYEEVDVVVRIGYTSKGKLPSEEAMHTAVGMIVNDSNPSIIDGVEITSVKVLEENLQF